MTTTMTIEYRGQCVLVRGSIPVSAFESIAALAPRGSVMCADTARVLGCNFAFGPEDQLAKLRTEAAPAAVALEVAQRQPVNKVQHKVAQWLGAGEVGSSSKCMALWLGLGKRTRDTWAYPHDPDDMDRCLKMLAAVPELRERLPRMADLSPVWAALVARWDEIEASQMDEIGIGWTKAKKAPRTYALMKEVIESARAAK